MGMIVKHGQVLKKDEYERTRVAFVVSVRGEKVLQFITAMLMLKRFKGEDGVPKFAGPIYAGWDNLRHTYAEQLHDLELVGAIAAIPDGEFKGQIDWVRPVDGGKIAEMRKAAVAKHEPAAPTHETLRFPLDLERMAQDLMFDTQLNQELRTTSGGADMLHVILKAAVRHVKGEA